MDKFYILDNSIADVEYDAILEGEYNDLETLDFPFEIGIQIKKVSFDLPVVIHIDMNAARGILTDYLHIVDVEALIFSDSVINFFEREGVNNFQTFPLRIIDNYYNVEDVVMAKLRGQDELEYEVKKYHNYNIINIIGALDCIDHISSKLEYYLPKAIIPDDMPQNMIEVIREQNEQNDVDYIRHLELDINKIPEDIKIFRLKDCSRILIFKEVAVEAIKEAGLTGFVFIPLEEYTDEISDEDDLDDDEIIEEKEPSPEELEEQKIVALKKEREEAYEQMQERIRKRREAGEGPSLIA